MIELNFVYVLTAAVVISLTQLDLVSDAVPIQSHSTAQHILDLRKQPALDAAASHQNLQLSQNRSMKRVNVHPALTTRYLAFVAQAMKRDGDNDGDTPPGLEDDSDETSEPGDGTDDADADGGAGGAGDSAAGNGTASGGGGNGTDTGSDKGHEITISIPKYEKDHMGNWVYHKWGATYGNILGDTRFNHDQFTIPRIRVDSNASINYYPDGPRSTVCMGSTIYNVPRVQNWLRRNVYTEVHKTRPFWDSLRMQIYTQGNSEECHDPIKYAKWQDYQNCAMRRNQRMEYYIPKYPLHQIGYRGLHPPKVPNLD